MSGQHHTEKEFVKHGGLFSLTPHFTLVPEQLYREEDNDLWLNFLREHIPHNQHITAEAIPLYGCVCLYEADEQNRQHAVCHLLELSEQIADVSFAMAYLTEQSMVWIAVKNKQLQHAMVYDIASSTDVLYYMLNALTQLDLQIGTPVYLYGEYPADWLSLLKEYLIIITANRL